MATGQNTTLDAALVTACVPVAEELRGMFGQYGVFGEDLRDPNVDEQTNRWASWDEKAKCSITLVLPCE